MTQFVRTVYAAEIAIAEALQQGTVGNERELAEAAYSAITSLRSKLTPPGTDSATFTPAHDAVEAVARIIDPKAWAIVDQHASYVARSTIPLERQRVESIEKARQILALSALPAQSRDVVEEESDFRIAIWNALRSQGVSDEACYRAINSIIDELAKLRARKTAPAGGGE